MTNSPKNSSIEIKTVEEFDSIVKHSAALLVFFSGRNCNVCTVLKPKIEDLLSRNFPRIEMAYTTVDEAPELFGQERVFTVPTIHIYFEGKLTIQSGKNTSINELSNEISKRYSILFEK